MQYVLVFFFPFYFLTSLTSPGRINPHPRYPKGGGIASIYLGGRGLSARLNASTVFFSSVDVGPLYSSVLIKYQIVDALKKQTSCRFQNLEKQNSRSSDGLVICRSRIEPKL